ncbi:MAG: IS66 family transposase [Armatimonadetes bacterium]|nr:IS66 family transposase [Armatimonadota bacterium]
MVTRSQAQAIYEQGPDAVYAVLVAMDARIQALEAQVAALQAQVADLTARLGKDSHNSSKPPSSDGLRRPPRSQREPGQRPTGGQKGHPGHTLCQVEQPDSVVVHRPAVCGRCGHGLEGLPVTERAERRQVFELPQPRLEVTEHRVGAVVCPVCGRSNQAEFPAAVRQPAQWGPRLLGLGVYLVQYQLLPLARCRQVLLDLCGQAPSEATLLHAVADCHTALAPVEAALQQAVGRAAVAHFDETGVRVAGRLEWLHVASTASLTHLAHHRRRGRVALTDIGLLPAFGGVAVHDAYPSYRDFGSGEHALCNAHLLRELQGCWEREHQTWAQRLRALLRGVLHAKQLAQAAGETALPPEFLARLRANGRRLVARGLAQNPRPQPTGKGGAPKLGPARSLLERLQRYEAEHLRFAFDFRVPFDNNQAERDFRMAKVQQKVSGCLRTSAGADQFCRLRGYLSTLRKQGVDLLDALRRVVAGSPVWPCLGPT